MLVVVLWPGERARPEVYDPFDVDLFDARVVDLTEGTCPGGPEPGTDVPVEVRCSTVTIEIEEGPDAGTEATFNYVESPGAAHLEEGDGIVAGYAPEAAPEFRYYFADFQRTTPLLLLTLLFVGSVLLLGRLGGLRALIGAGASLAVVVVFLIPALLDGTSPVLAALVASGLIAVLALYLTHGVNNRTNVAFLGTTAALGLTAALAAIFVAATNLTGLVNEDVTFLQLGDNTIDVTGLLLAGIVIGALGVLDDVTVTQVSAVWELHAADPDASARQVYDAAIRIGRDHIASTVNTLVLAYTGAALPLLLLFQQGGQPLGQVLTGEAVATEVVRALVGSIGLVASVPITTGLAVIVVGARRGPDAGRDADGDAPDGEVADGEVADAADAGPSDGPPTSPPLPAAPVAAAEPEPGSDPPPPSWEDFTPEERGF